MRKRPHHDIGDVSDLFSRQRGYRYDDDRFSGNRENPPQQTGGDLRWGLSGQLTDPFLTTRESNMGLFARTRNFNPGSGLGSLLGDPMMTDSDLTPLQNQKEQVLSSIERQLRSELQLKLEIEMEEKLMRIRAQLEAAEMVQRRFRMKMEMAEVLEQRMREERERMQLEVVESQRGMAARRAFGSEDQMTLYNRREEMRFAGNDGPSVLGRNKEMPPNFGASRSGVVPPGPWTNRPGIRPQMEDAPFLRKQVVETRPLPPVWDDAIGEGGQGRRHARNYNPEAVALRKLVILNLDTQLSEADIREYVENFGNVEKIDLVVNRQTKLSKGVCFVIFEKAATVDIIQAGRPHTLGRKVATTKRMVLERDKALNLLNSNRISIGEPTTFAFHCGTGGLTAYVKDEDIKEYFSQLGGVKSVVRDMEKGRVANSATVVFKDEDTADKAVLMSVHEIKGRVLEAKKMEPLPPDAEEEVNVTGDPEHFSLRRVYVLDLPAGAAEKHLRETFEKFGNIEDVQLETTESLGTSLGVVMFDKAEAVEKVMNQRKIRVAVTKVPKPVTVKRLHLEDLDLDESSIVRFTVDFGAKEPVNEDVVKEYFTKFGTVESVKYIGPRKRLGLATFSKKDEADKVAMLHLHLINKKKFFCVKGLPFDTYRRKQHQKQRQQQLHQHMVESDHRQNSGMPTKFQQWDESPRYGPGGFSQPADPLGPLVARGPLGDYTREMGGRRGGQQTAWGGGFGDIGFRRTEMDSAARATGMGSMSETFRDSKFSPLYNEEPDVREDQSVVVTGLTKKLKLQDILKHFHKFGKVENLQRINDEKARVVFKEQYMREYCLKKRVQTLGDVEVSVHDPSQLWAMEAEQAMSQLAAATTPSDSEKTVSIEKNADSSRQQVVEERGNSDERRQNTEENPPTAASECHNAASGSVEGEGGLKNTVDTLGDSDEAGQMQVEPSAGGERRAEALGSLEPPEDGDIILLKQGRNSISARSTGIAGSVVATMVDVVDVEARGGIEGEVMPDSAEDGDKDDAVMII